MIEAWHFVGKRLRDGRPVPPDGVTLRHDGDLELRWLGLHASERIIDALSYAPGNTICRVVLGGRIMLGTDKMVASERTIIWRLEDEALLYEFARWCALQVIHLWDAPDVVRRYLDTGDESLRAAAAAAAAVASQAVAGSAAAWAAAENAARHAARNAAEAAVRNAQNSKLEAMVMAARHAQLEIGGGPLINPACGPT